MNIETATTAGVDLAACDREPIHIPGSIQPHGVLLLADLGDLAVRYVAGDVETRLGPWSGLALGDLIGKDLAERGREMAAERPGGFLGQVATVGGETLDVLVHRSSGFLVVELEPASANPAPSAVVLAGLDAAIGGFERANTLKALCERAAAEFRRLTGYDRVMVYRFLEDGAGSVLAEDRKPELHSFLNHHFPASDIPRQARALYTRNLVRVIPDVAYRPAPLRPAWAESQPLDMSDSVLRSVSPIHLQYLANMGVGASASVSVVKDGVLWGLIACHNATPLAIPFDMRAACRALAGAFARQVKLREDAETYRERIRLLGFEEEVSALLSREGSLDSALAHHLDEVRRMLGSDGVGVLRGDDLVTGGMCPPEAEIRAMAAWVADKSTDTVFASERLADVYPPASVFRASASGLLAITLSLEDPWIVLWFRAEQVEVINWAGNPHKNAEAAGNEVLTPRASFEAWRETVHGQSRRWTLAETEAAARLRASILEVRRNRQIQDLNRQLVQGSHEKDLLIQQKEFLIGEVNHRVQNSLQLVSSFLALQARDSELPELRAALEEARSRLGAVALVHRRLYRADQIESIDAARYIDELAADLKRSMGDEWTHQLTLDLAPLMLPADRAVTVGLILTELIINANKYAYGGRAGPVDVTLLESQGRLQLVVADHGVGKSSVRHGFGSRMMDALVAQLGGDLSYGDNQPGLRVTLIAPLAHRA